MFSNVYLAVTSREMENFLPKKAAYLSCHFSPSGQGLSNLPRCLPENSLLLLDDSMPVCGHSPGVVIKQLRDLVKDFSVKAVLLDFQGEKTEQLQAMAQEILRSTPCPVAITDAYAKGFGCPVFLSPPPADRSLEKHISKWLKQGVYLEIAPCSVKMEVTETGCRKTALPSSVAGNLLLHHENLCCHYDVEVFPDRAVFTLDRTKDDLAALAEKAMKLGVLGTVGLYQELLK